MFLIWHLRIKSLQWDSVVVQLQFNKGGLVQTCDYLLSFFSDLVPTQYRERLQSFTHNKPLTSFPSFPLRTGLTLWSW